MINLDLLQKSAFAKGYIVLLTLAFFFSKAAADILASGLAILFIIDAIKHKNFSWLNDRWLQFGLAFCALLTAQTAFIDPLSEETAKAFFWCRFVFFTLGVQYFILTSKAHTIFALKALLIFLVALCADLILQGVIGVDFLGKEPANVGRLSGPYNAPRAGSYIFYFAYPVIAYIAYQQQTGSCKIFALPVFAFLLFISCIVLSGDRTPLVLSLIGLACISLCSTQFRMLAIAGAALLPAAYFFFITSDLHPILTRQLYSSIHTIMDFQHRSYGEIWIDSWNLSMQSPWFGHGIDQYIDICKTTHLTLKESCHNHPHSIHLEVLFSTGLIGLAAFSGMVFYLISAFWPRANTKNILLNAILITVLLRLFPAPVASFFSSVSAIPFWYVVALGFATKHYFNK